MWWYPYRLNRGYAVPVDGAAKAIESPSKPPGHYWGPFHCQACADLCANFGKTESQAWLFNHGTGDEKFAVFLSA
ncbi:MAG: hypothetical protein IT296_02760 [Anaerolineae bacterium]|nr:hypothetical protein [Anaerolineae bacterium]